MSDLIEVFCIPFEYETEICINFLLSATEYQYLNKPNLMFFFNKRGPTYWIPFLEEPNLLILLFNLSQIKSWNLATY